MKYQNLIILFYSLFTIQAYANSNSCFELLADSKSSAHWMYSQSLKGISKNINSFTYIYDPKNKIFGTQTNEPILRRDFILDKIENFFANFEIVSEEQFLQISQTLPRASLIFLLKYDTPNEKFSLSYIFFESSHKEAHLIEGYGINENLLKLSENLTSSFDRIIYLKPMALKKFLVRYMSLDLANKLLDPQNNFQTSMPIELKLSIYTDNKAPTKETILKISNLRELIKLYDQLMELTASGLKAHLVELN